MITSFLLYPPTRSTLGIFGFLKENVVMTGEKHMFRHISVNYYVHCEMGENKKKKRKSQKDLQR